MVNDSYMGLAGSNPALVIGTSQSLWRICHSSSRQQGSSGKAVRFKLVKVERRMGARENLEANAERMPWSKLCFLTLFIQDFPGFLCRRVVYILCKSVHFTHRTMVRIYTMWGRVLVTQRSHKPPMSVRFRPPQSGGKHEKSIVCGDQ